MASERWIYFAKLYVGIYGFPSDNNESCHYENVKYFKKTKAKELLNFGRREILLMLILYM